MNNSKLTQPILQRPIDLVFAVIDSSVLELLTVLKTQTLKIANYTIHFAIIGESHCISVLDHDQFIMQEVLACTDIPDILQAHSHKFAKLEPYHYRKQDYQARVWFEDTMQQTHWENQDELMMDFPKIFEQTPFTKIQWVTSNTSVQWRTTHVYPLKTHTTYVYTESYFDLAERNNDERINETNA